jgi:hypothetical protein
MALRLKYAGIDPAAISVERDLGRSLDLAVADGRGPLYALPTYTALLDLRELLAERGLLERVEHGDREELRREKLTELRALLERE